MTPFNTQTQLIDTEGRPTPIFYKFLQGLFDVPVNPLEGSVTYDPPNLAAGAVSPITTLSVSGALIGMPVMLSFLLDTQGVVFSGWVSAPNTVSVVLQNQTAGAINLASGTLTAYVNQG